MRPSTFRTQPGAARANLQLRAQNLLSCVQTPLPRLTSSTSQACRARRATWGAPRRARWSAGHGMDSTARHRHSKREARDHREAAGVSPIQHIEHLEYLEKRWIDLTCASSPLRAHRRARTPSGSARWTSDKPKFVLTHKASTTRPSLGR
ncbi:hypothetical protein T492DRAFT_1037122 [Pavlovales sp. CCMP2436]|nr:hypothetical protein T492DRAFT_1037122 [Pavlovales sp. CCMP2436]